MTCATFATDSDAAERYVLGQMGEAEQTSFEEHFFGCDACFASVQTLQQMQTALRGAPAQETLVEQTAASVAAPAAVQPAASQPVTAQSSPQAAPQGATVVTFPAKRGFAGIDAKWWGLAVAATLLLTTMWWPRRGVERAAEPNTT